MGNWPKTKVTVCFPNETGSDKTAWTGQKMGTAFLDTDNLKKNVSWNIIKSKQKYTDDCNRPGHPAGSLIRSRPQWLDTQRVWPCGRGEDDLLKCKASDRRQTRLEGSLSDSECGERGCRCQAGCSEYFPKLDFQSQINICFPTQIIKLLQTCTVRTLEPQKTTQEFFLRWFVAAEPFSSFFFFFALPH